MYLDARALLPHIPPLEYPGQALAVELYRAGGIRGCEIGTVMFGKHPDGTEAPAAMDLVRLAIPRRTYTQSHVDYVIEVARDVARAGGLAARLPDRDAAGPAAPLHRDVRAARLTQGAPAVPMPDMTEQTETLVAWLQENALALVVVAVGLLLLYRWARPTIHRVLTQLVATQAKTLADNPVAASDTAKRVATIEDLLVKALKAGVILALVVLVLGIFDLWSVLAGVGLVLAALTLAGQSIVLDYLMGILILVEGQYFKGDVVRINAIEGTVEEVGLRRTLVRDVRGTLHSVSNGEIRMSANLTRTYAVAMVLIDGVPDQDLDRAIAVLEQVGRDLAADPALEGLFLDTPGYTGTTALTSAGATIRLSGRVMPEERIKVEVEMRRRVAARDVRRGDQAHPADDGAAARLTDRQRCRGDRGQRPQRHSMVPV